MDLIATYPIAAILIALLSGGAGTLLLSRFMMSKKDAADVATQLYTAMQGQLTAMQGHVTALQSTIDDWKGKYYHLLEECNTVKLENQQMVAQIGELMIECNELKVENQQLRAEIDLINPKPALYQGHAKPESLCS